MIKEIGIHKKENTQEVLKLQKLAYEIEAELIGSTELPPLKDTLDTLQNCSEEFYGYYENKRLHGVISVDIKGSELAINRLFVDPDHFNRGIAQLLLDYIQSTFNVQKIKVSTGTKNNPAVNFYRKNGLDEVKEELVDGQISLSFFEKKL